MVYKFHVRIEYYSFVLYKVAFYFKPRELLPPMNLPLYFNLIQRCWHDYWPCRIELNQRIYQPYHSQLLISIHLAPLKLGT